MIHPGLIGTAPSHELLAIWNKRERALVEEGEKARTLCAHLATRPLGESCYLSLACLPGLHDKQGRAGLAMCTRVCLHLPPAEW